MGRVKSIPLTPSGERGSPHTTTPVFARIGIVGLGRTGGSVGLAIRRAWPSALVVGVDANDALERAIRSHAIDVGGSDLVMLNGVDLIVLTGTAEQSAEVLAALDQCVPGPVVVTATCGAPVVADAARALPPRLTFVAGDLVEAGHSQGGAVSADPGWLADREWRLLPAPDDPAAAIAVARLRAFVAALGADPRVAG
jgi:prephenate dehydrogenase